MAEPAPPPRRLAAIMFTDLVGYSALAHRDEALAIELLELHRGWVREILPRHGGKEIETVGDAFLVEFAGALAAVECAVAIQQRFGEHNASAPQNRRMELRIGVHLGDVEHKDGKVMGDGVNIASRIDGMAEPGGICVSETVYQVIRNRADLAFDSLGTPALKNISTSLELFQVLPAGVGRSRAAFWSRIARPIRTQGRVLAAVAVVAVITGAFVGEGLFRPAQAPMPSVAVLPFSNLSESPEASDYLVGGMHEAILTHLARVKGLKVISRTSVMEYKDKARNLREIGEALGVAHVVEGSVQRVGKRVRVTAQLIATEDDQHVWVENYDRDVADVFAIESDVAQHVAVGIQAALTPEEKRRIERRPTSNAEAYDLYMKAQQLELQTDNNRDTIFRIQALLEQAVRQDPAFALAHAGLGRNHMMMYWFGIDATAERRDQARIAVETALRLQPDLAEGHFAMGTYFHQGFRDYERAMKEYDEALRRSPNSARFLEFVGYVQRRRGQWDSAIASLDRCVELDPRNPQLLFSLAETYAATRRYAMGVSLLEKELALWPDSIDTRLSIADTMFKWKGDLTPLRTTLAEIPPGTDPGLQVSKFRIRQSFREGKYAEAVALLAAFPGDRIALDTIAHFGGPKSFFVGQAQIALGAPAEARPQFMQARDLLQTYIANEPQSGHLAIAHAWLGLTQAYLGDQTGALRNADRALEILPVSRDAYDGPEIVRMAAAIYARLGYRDRALAELERVLQLPGWHGAQEFRLDPDFIPLRSDPRFRKLIADYLPRDAG